MNRFLLLSLTLLLATASLAYAQKVPITTTSDAARTHYVQGEHATGNVDFERARTHFAAALAADPDFAMAHLYSAVLSGGDQRAEHMRQATANAARASEAERQMIESYAANERDDHDREGTLLATVAERFPSDPMPMFWWANTEANRGNNAEAVAAARRSLTADPSFAPAYNLIGYAEVARGDMAAAEQAFREYIRLAPDEANPYDSFGEFYLNQGKLDEAEAQYEMALTKNARFENARTMLARVALERSDLRFEQAVADGDADAIAALYTPNAIALPPDSPPVQGRDAIRDLFAGYIEAGIDGVDIQTVEVNRFDDIAIRRSDIVISAGGQVVDLAKSLEVWRLADGEWLYVRDMWNSNGTSETASAR
ncbi:MAG: tetratricopeptide repeat protein [Bacteroidetes bacterium]|jgi:uncharacterized protein (TIGR02246 family)|nr:tetratricopeptide repeat protein [Bacteroidota bacterium]